MRQLCLFCSCFLLSLASNANADVQSLKPGMTFSEVIAAKGAPLEKDDHEVSRVVIWKYKDSSLRFFNGRLQIASTAEPKAGVSRSNLRANTVESKPQSKRDESLSQDVVDEIIDALPNEPAAGQPGVQAPPSEKSGESPFMSAP